MTTGRTERAKEKATEAVKGTIQNWESGELGQSAEHAVPISPEEMAALDTALELRPISIRLQRELVAKLKFIAFHHGIGYQPLVRDILNRFASHEFVRIARQIQEERQAESALSDEDSPAAKYMRDCA